MLILNPVTNLGRDFYCFWGRWKIELMLVYHSEKSIFGKWWWLWYPCWACVTVVFFPSSVISVPEVEDNQYIVLLKAIFYLFTATFFRKICLETAEETHGFSVVIQTGYRNKFQDFSNSWCKVDWFIEYNFTGRFASFQSWYNGSDSTKFLDNQHTEIMHWRFWGVLHRKLDPELSGMLGEYQG